MSWDATLAKTSDANFNKPADNATFLPMGKPAEIRAKLTSAVPSITWSNSSEGHAYVGPLSLEFSLSGKLPSDFDSTAVQRLKESEDVESIGVSARGNGDPITVLVNIAKTNQWSLADAQEGAWVDLSKPTTKSWTQFTEFRDQIAGNPQGAANAGERSVANNLLISAAVLVVVILLAKFLFK